MQDDDHMTREQHLAWAKERALEYVERGEASKAIASFAMDLTKHSQTSGFSARIFTENAMQAALNGTFDCARVRLMIESYA